MRAILARLKQPSRAEFPLLDIPPAAGIALHAGSRRQLLHRAEVVGKIHLHSIYRAVLPQIHRQRLRGVVRGSLPPVLHVFIDCVRCRLLRALLAGRRDRLPVGEQHPGRLREGILRKSVGVRRPVSVPLIAEQLSIPVKAGRPDADAPLKCVIHRDPHRRGVPPASLPILHRGAMSRARHKSARLIGERIVRRRPERSERGIPLIHAVRVDIIFRPRAGILQIIPAPVLCHPGALNIRRIRHGHLRHLPLLRWQRPDRLLHHLHRHLGRIQPRLLRDHGLHDFEDRAASRLEMMIFSDPLISQTVMAVADENLRLADPVHRRRIELYAPDRRHIAASPVEIEFPVIIQKQVRVPEIKRPRDPLKLPGLRVLRAVEIADCPAPARAEIHPVPDRAHIRRIIIRRHILQRHLPPVHHVLADQKAAGHARENVILSLEQDHRRICRLAVQRKSAFLLLIKLIAVAHVDWITEITTHTYPLSLINRPMPRRSSCRSQNTGPPCPAEHAGYLQDTSFILP